jgi:hypothetical protein
VAKRAFAAIAGDDAAVDFDRFRRIDHRSRGHFGMHPS